MFNRECILIGVLVKHIAGVGKVFNEKATCKNLKLPESQKFCLRC